MNLSIQFPPPSTLPLPHSRSCRREGKFGFIAETCRLARCAHGGHLLTSTVFHTATPPPSFDTCMVSLMCFEEVGRGNEHMIFTSALNTCRWRRRRRRSRIKTRVPKVGTYLGVGSSCHQEIHLDGQRKCVECFKGKGRWRGSMLQAQI